MVRYECLVSCLKEPCNTRFGLQPSNKNSCNAWQEIEGIYCTYVRDLLSPILAFLIVFHEFCLKCGERALPPKVTMCWKLRLRLLNFDNGADMSYIIIGWGAILRQALDQNRLEKPFMAIFSAMAWLRALCLGFASADVDVYCLFYMGQTPSGEYLPSFPDS